MANAFFEAGMPWFLLVGALALLAPTQLAGLTGFKIGNILTLGQLLGGLMLVGAVMSFRK